MAFDGEIRIAVMNDIHNSMEFIARFLQYWALKKIEVDYLIVCGDICDVRGVDQSDPQIVQDKIDVGKRIIAELEKACPTVLYVPGNHDPTTLFHNSMTHSVQLSENSVNLHRCVYHLAENLVVVGCGGSIPQYDKHICHKEGYPFENDEQFKKQLDEIMPDDGEIPTTKMTDSIIVVTHCGPSCSHTALKFSHKKSMLQTGSPSLSSKVENSIYRKRLTCVLHGHTHNSRGLVNHEMVPIINAGSIKVNQYFVTLSLREIKGNWKITDTSFHCFGYF
ncbi:hypothetical protein EIN_377180 [Entamoeba invadens IP1]|uniref:Calcineurin-like phosphoesterase domain-containing protein n=1 Tax=Entamoeba invadens IP1 TaxID=370355 RepID=A0A0A1TW35_ENTIV|nr:hypothetical protein EIN_377180 [Entamoeba invadens IP1]ELP83493.1 hypothetical protein EIN_377180 [Entamoeba invadens IP1]|eukprot:XP_004182839.1 hypothetical protein EIN_377180 [Entamoeba invadens IP1]